MKSVPFSSYPSILHFCDFSRVPTGSADYTPGLPSVLRRDCTTPLLLGGCGETRGGIWSCIYAAAKVLSARSTSRFSRKNPFRKEIRGLSGCALYRKFGKIPRHTTIIFEKFRTCGSPADIFGRISLWRDEPGQNSSGRSEYIRPGAAARGTNVRGEGENEGMGGTIWVIEGAPPPGESRGPHFITQAPMTVLNLGRTWSSRAVARTFHHARNFCVNTYPSETAALYSSAVSLDREGIEPYVHLHPLNVSVRTRERKNNRENICFYFYPTREYSSVSERVRCDGCARWKMWKVFDNRVTEAFAFDNVISRNDVTAPTPAARSGLARSLGISSFLAEKTNFSQKFAISTEHFAMSYNM